MLGRRLVIKKGLALAGAVAGGGIFALNATPAQADLGGTTDLEKKFHLDHGWDVDVDRIPDYQHAVALVNERLRHACDYTARLVRDGHVPNQRNFTYSYNIYKTGSPFRLLVIIHATRNPMDYKMTTAFVDLGFKPAHLEDDFTGDAKGAASSIYRFVVGHSYAAL